MTADQVRFAIEHQTTRAVGGGAAGAIKLGRVASGVTAPRLRPAVHQHRSAACGGAGPRLCGPQPSQPDHSGDAHRPPGPGRLADDQANVLHRFNTGDDRVIAPAGAGKATTTIGAATRIWQAAGYQMIGRAPSARAHTASNEPARRRSRRVGRRHVAQDTNLHPSSTYTPRPAAARR
jgi:AAA domain